VVDGKNTLNGTYWESAKANHVFVSYQASLFEQGGIIDYTHSRNFLLPGSYNCFFDRFVSEMNVQHIVLHESLWGFNVSANQMANVAKILKNQGTDHYQIEKAGSIGLGFYDKSPEKTFNIYQVQRKEGSLLTNQLVETVGVHPEVREFNKRKPFYFSQYTSFIGDFCARTPSKNHASDRNILFIEQNDAPRFQTLVEESIQKSTEPFAGPQPTIQKIGEGEFKINLHSQEDVFFKIKLAPRSEFNLYASSGERLPTFEGIAYLVSYGHGEVVLKYERSPIMKISYGISLLAFLAFVSVVFYARRVTRGR
jgi:hypothetical protein